MYGLKQTHPIDGRLKSPLTGQRWSVRKITCTWKLSPRVTFENVIMKQHFSAVPRTENLENALEKINRYYCKAVERLPQ